MQTGTIHLRTEVLRSILDYEVLGVAIFQPTSNGDSDFETTYANGMFQSLKPHVSMVGRKFSEVWPEAADRFVPAMHDVLESGKPLTVQDAVEIEREPGRMSTGYFTFRISRLVVDGEPWVLSEVQETTAQVVAQHQATRELETTRLLLEASQALTERVELQHVLSKLAEVLLTSTAHKRSFVFSWNEETRMLTRAASAGLSAFPSGQTFSFADVSDVTKRVIVDRISAVVDFDSLPEAQRGRALAAQQSHVLVVVPVVWQDRLVGLIGVDDPGERHEFTSREIEIVEGIAAQAATAIENARLFEERAEALRGLQEKDRDIRQAYSDVIDAVTGGRLIILGADELDQALVEPKSEEQEIHEAVGLGDARRWVREAVGVVPCINDLVLAFSEGVTNMLKHAGGGTYWVAKDKARVQMILSDNGTGIDFRDLPKATLLHGYSTKQTLGVGFTLMMELSDRVLLCTDSHGTTIVLEKDLVTC